MMQVAISELGAPVRFQFTHPLRSAFEAFEEFCRANLDLRAELTAQGEIIVMPPASGESDYRSVSVSARLERWASVNGRGKAFGSSAGFRLPDGSVLSPDAAWVSNAALAKLTPRQRKEFLPLCPEFVVEVRSPSDSLPELKRKMELWIANGAQLGWLVDGDARTVYVYRKNRPTKTHRGITELAGEGPVKGFVLKLGAIWRGLA
jgi:Uma2 family endonuclease